MNKQEISDILKKEIATVNENLKRLQGLYVQAIRTQSPQAKVIDNAIQDLIAHKKNLERIVEKIFEDARSSCPPYRFGL